MMKKNDERFSPVGNFFWLQNAVSFLKRLCFSLQKTKLILHIKVTCIVLQPPCLVWTIEIT